LHAEERISKLQNEEKIMKKKKMGTTYKRDKLRDFIKLVLRKYDKVFSLFEIS
jgi:hypothetical protein